MLRAALGCFVSLSVIALVAGHGRLIDPASRNAAWRFGFDTPKHYTDNELNCGGYSHQWDKNQGKCGVCGDPYDKKNPEFIHPGAYAKGVITKTYREGQEIEVVVHLTSNHQGFFVFRVGKIGTPPITQEKLTHVLKQPNGLEKFKITSNGNQKFKIKLRLPKGVTCDRCVMQWWYTTGNSWGCDPDGTCGVGHGKKQETFVNCADIRITASDGSVTTDPPPPPTQAPPPSTQAPLPPTQPPSTTKPMATTPLPTGAPGGCKAVGAWAGNPNMDEWCVTNCALGNCPASMCKC